MTTRNQSQNQGGQQQTSGKQNANPPAENAGREPAQRKQSGMQADHDASKQNSQRNEGEGNRTADREYREQASKFAEQGNVAASAEEARDALEGPEGEELERARRESARGHDKKN